MIGKIIMKIMYVFKYHHVPLYEQLKQSIFCIKLIKSNGMIRKTNKIIKKGIPICQNIMNVFLLFLEVYNIGCVWSMSNKCHSHL